jgi:hypothetical protein
MRSTPQVGSREAPGSARRRRRAGGYMAGFTGVDGKRRSPLLLTATALAVVCTVSLSPAMANRFGPFDTRLTDDSDRLGQNGVNAARTTSGGRHYEWQYHYGHEWEGHLSKGD